MTRTLIARTSIAALCCLTLSAAAHAQAKPAAKPGLIGDLAADVTEVEGKIVGLAKALPDKAYDWRPAAGVRSGKEVLIHIAGDNYFLPAMIGTPAPAATGITGTEYKTVEAYEKRERTRAQVIADLEQSFAFLKQSLDATTESALETPAKSAGPSNPSTRKIWVATVTHLHEHLGQLIAYARSNGVTPPWSK